MREKKTDNKLHTILQVVIHPVFHITIMNIEQILIKTFCHRILTTGTTRLLYIE